MAASLYIHIPFCAQACHYCSFYFVVTTSQKEYFITTLKKEIGLRKSEIENEIDTIYFGGGTPSILTPLEIQDILTSIYANFQIANNAEICIESNPENLSKSYLKELKRIGINRLSIGVQSFFDTDLKSMNRVHDSKQSIIAIKEAQNYFENFSIDLMFGLPYSGLEHWKQNLEIASSMNIPHISTYNLTIEEKTYLARKIAKKELKVERDATLNDMYYYTLDFLRNIGYINYEISNFGKEKHFSNHNIAYWTQKPYLGFGPSAHSYSNKIRKWNIPNLNNYLKNLNSNIPYWEEEILTHENLYNEFVLTRIRTIFGIEKVQLESNFGQSFANHFFQNIQPFIDKKMVEQVNDSYVLTDTGKVLADHITLELMK